MTDASPMSTSVMQIVEPVWLNTYWVENALGLCEGIWQHAEELNTDHGHFFSLVVKYAIDSTVLGICKLYDLSNPKYKKDTVPNLNEYLRHNFTTTYACRLDASILADLGASEDTARQIVASLKEGTKFSEAKIKMFSIIDENMPQPGKGSPLKLLFTHRNKTIAHQQQLTASTELVKEELKSLPSLHDMLTLNKWAIDFCRLVVAALSNESLLHHAVSARVAALNVVAKVLGKNFDQINSGAAYQEWESFYSRL